MRYETHSTSFVSGHVPCPDPASQTRLHNLFFERKDGVRGRIEAEFVTEERRSGRRGQRTGKAQGRGGEGMQDGRGGGERGKREKEEGHYKRKKEKEK